MLTVIGVYEITEVIKRDAKETLNGLAANKADQLGLHFAEIERAVDNLSTYIEETAEPERLATAPLTMNLYMNDVRERCETAAILSGAETVYFRMDPEVYGGRAGVFLSGNGQGNYINMTPTDLLAYNQDDREHVGWYYETVDHGTALWMDPYVNRNINIYMISYVMPVYAQGEFLGVVGMDINMETIIEALDDVDYADGFGFLVSENRTLIYHPDFPEGLNSLESDEELTSLLRFLTPNWAATTEVATYTWEGEEQELAAENLENGMILGISASEKEIMAPRTKMLEKVLIVFLIILGVVFLVAWRIMERIVRPILHLTDAAARISKGELNTPIDYHAEDEIGKLADSIRKMSRELQEYIGFIHAQAYTDAMTGIGNKAAYMDQMQLLDRKIHEGLARFAIAVFDINGLKRVNDELGHEFGDLLIQDAAAVLKKVYGAEVVYRIGGDEFVAVLDDHSLKEMQQYRTKFQEELLYFNQDEHPYKVKLAVSNGYAVFHEGEDTEYKEVFQRADESMYQDKERYYRGRNDRRKR